MANKNTDKTLGVRNRKLSIAEMTGCVVLPVAGLLSLVDSGLTVGLLTLFIVLCALAPFFPCSGFFLPVICRGNPSKHSVSLTFDDGPDPVITPMLIDLLSIHGVLATFFIMGKKAERHPGLIEAILCNGHSVCNHTYSHDPAIMLRRVSGLKNDIAAAQAVLENQGIVSYAFRPPAGITNPLLGPVLASLGMFTVNFSCRAVDFGNRRLKDLSGKIVGKAKPGDIVMMHDTLPADERLVPVWFGHVEAVILGLRDKGLAIVPLDELIGRPVMAVMNRPSSGPVTPQ